MATRKPKRKGRSGGSGMTWVKALLFTVALVLAAFFTLMQVVRSGFYGELPSQDELSAIRHEQATLVLDRDGELIGKIFAQDRTNVKYADLPKHLVDALVSTEDSRFFSHAGVDGRSYLRVFFRTLLGRDKSAGGGSTISQQIIKNLYGRQRHGLLTIPVNKMKEALVAQRLERALNKEDVLVLYFNSVPFGENTYGVEAAAQRYFSKSAKRLNVQESAVLVGMLKANTSYNPRLHPKASKGRRDQVLEQMFAQEHLTQVQLDSLKKLPLELFYSGGGSLDLYGYFVQRVAKEARQVLEEREKRTGVHYDIEKDGLRITTTLDAGLQRIAVEALHTQLAAVQPDLDRELRNRKVRATWEKQQAKIRGQRWKLNVRIIGEVYDHGGRRLDSLHYRDSLWHYHRMLNGAMLMMEPGTGAVRAWVGGNDHRYLPYDLVLARRQIASTIKPVLYAAALERGIEPCTYLSNEKQTYAEFDDWEPDNFGGDSTGGKVAMWYALAKSMNRPTVDLYFRTGADTIRSTLAGLGLPTKDAEKPAMALGVTDIALHEIVPAYGAFAMRGKLVRPQLIAQITDPQGNVVYQATKPKGQQAVSANTAADITTMLRRAVDQGTGTPLRSRYGVTSPFAGKTGTSQNYSDAWFVAYTPGLVIGTWVGAFDNDIHFQGAAGTGGHLALPIAGKVIRRMETSAELRKRYIANFDANRIDLDCDPRRSGSGFEEFIKDVFGKKEPDHRKLLEESLDENGLPKEEKKENFFDRLFKKKR